MCSYKGPITRSGHFELANMLRTLHVHNHACQEPHHYLSQKVLKFQTVLAPLFLQAQHGKRRGWCFAPPLPNVSSQNVSASLNTMTCDTCQLTKAHIRSPNHELPNQEAVFQRLAPQRGLPALGTTVCALPFLFVILLLHPEASACAGYVVLVATLSYQGPGFAVLETFLFLLMD